MDMYFQDGDARIFRQHEYFSPEMYYLLCKIEKNSALNHAANALK